MKNHTEDIIKDVRASKDTVIKFLGFKDRAPRAVIERKIDKELEHFSEFLDLYYCYNINLDKMYADVVYTIGERYEKEIEKLIEKGQAFPALALDKIGIVCLDNLRNYIIKEIYENHGLVPKKYIFPGSSEYPISFQREIYQSTMPKEVKINEFDQLSPVKSVAFRVLLQKDKEFKDKNPCESCDLNCEFRGCKRN